MSKARYWTAILWQESAEPDWEDKIAMTVQHPFAYCIHDQDMDLKQSEHRKPHAHILVAFPNTTTYNNALEVIKAISPSAINTVERVYNIRTMYDYLIHDTDDARKKGKYQYTKDCRITGNNFDIGAYEQVSMADKDRAVKEIALFIKEYSVTNFADLYFAIIQDHSDDSVYFDVLKTYSGFFERLTKGMYLKREELAKHAQGQQGRKKSS